MTTKNNNKKNQELTLVEKLMVERARRHVHALSSDKKKQMRDIICAKSKISMRSIERFNSALDIHPEYAAFWLLDPVTRKSEPVHIRRLIKELTDMFQEKNIKAFNRHKLVKQWPYSAAVCQLGYFPLALQFGMLDYFQSIETSKSTFFKPLQEELLTMKRTKRKTPLEMETKTERKRMGGIFMYENPVELPDLTHPVVVDNSTLIVTEVESQEQKKKRFRSSVVENKWFICVPATEEQEPIRGWIPLQKNEETPTQIVSQTASIALPAVVVLGGDGSKQRLINNNKKRNRKKILTAPDEENIESFKDSGLPCFLW